jgi:NAD(P)-dependent dehydrogenase (short-subunit alcohol dehydrogenase family)
MEIIITGGASGLGEAITRKVATDIADATIYITYSKSEQNALKLMDSYPNVRATKCDFANAGEVSDFTAKVKDINPDILIHNSYFGEFIKNHFHKIDAEDYLKSFEMNILPIIKISQQALLCFRKKKFGKIISISTAALINKPPIGASEYVANKSYLEALSKSWATENAGFNITSNCISPSFMETAFTQNMDERVVEEIKNKHPLKKLLTPEEVAETVLFLICAPQHINGISLVMNAASDIR